MLVLLAKYPAVQCNSCLHIAQKTGKVIKDSYKGGILQIIYMSVTVLKYFQVSFLIITQN